MTNVAAQPPASKAAFLPAFVRLLRARVPFVYVTTWEEDRLLDELIGAAESVQPARSVFVWTCVDGLARLDEPPIEGTDDPVAALIHIEQISEPSLFVLKDFHVHLRDEDRSHDNQRAIRKLRDVIPQLGADVPKAIVVVAPSVTIPETLEKNVTIVEFDLPGTDAIRDVLHGMVDRVRGHMKVELDAVGEDKLVHAALGLTIQEVEAAFGRAMVKDDVFDAADIDVILEEKRQIIARTEVLDFVHVEHGLEAVGGQDNLKLWLATRADAWLPEAAHYGLPYPKGLLITGVPGCGKSLTAKCVSAAWGLPLLRMDVGRIFDSYIGQSERRMRSALRTAEAVAPCVLWIDEIEKGFGGATGPSHDSGTTTRVFGTFLTWMQEKRQPVFVVATANSVEYLPPEFLRKGRFDEIFFVDLPTAAERRRIFEIHLERRQAAAEAARALAIDGTLLDELAGLSEEFSGAEIEQVVISAMFAAFAEHRSLRLDDIHAAIGGTVSLAQTQRERVDGLRRWASIAVQATPQAARAPNDYPATGVRMRGGAP